MREEAPAQNFDEPIGVLFSDAEAPTACLGPTPFTPPTGCELPDFVREPTDARSSSTEALYTPSRPGERPSFPQDPAQAVDAINDLLAKSRIRARASQLTPAPRVTPCAITVQAPRRTRRNRRHLIPLCSAMLAFGGVLGFLGYTFSLQLASVVHALEAVVPVLAATL